MTPPPQLKARPPLTNPHSLFDHPSTTHPLPNLRFAPALQALTLNLYDNCIRDAGAVALAALSDSTSLRALNLDLGLNPLGPAGVTALGALQRSSSLTELKLGLATRRVLRSPDATVAALAALKGVKALEVEPSDARPPPPEGTDDKTAASRSASECTRSPSSRWAGPLHRGRTVRCARAVPALSEK